MTVIQQIKLKPVHEKTNERMMQISYIMLAAIS